MGRRALLKPDERRRLFGAAEDEEGLVRHDSLTLMDRAEALARRRPHNQLGFAVQLCLMRHPGRPLAPGEEPPRAMLAFVADQLGLKGDLFAFYGRREDTRLAHAQHLQAYLGLRTATRDDRRTTLLAGIEICAPIHDAFLIQAPLERLDQDVGRMKDLMTGAGETVTGGFPVRTDATVVRYPDRYMDEGGQDMWDRVMALLSDEGREAA